MKYGVIGTGAIGGFYGGKLAKSGQEVHFLLHRDYNYVKSNGLQIDSCDGSFHLDAVNAYHRTADMPVCDVVLVCLKTINNGLLQELLPPLLGPKPSSFSFKTVSVWKPTCSECFPIPPWWQDLLSFALPKPNQAG